MLIGEDNIGWIDATEEIDHFLEDRRPVPDETIRAHLAETQNQFNLIDTGLLSGLPQSRFFFLLPPFNPSLGEPPMSSVAVPEEEIPSLASLADGVKDTTGRPFRRLTLIS
jgi:hypothetical protein